MFSYIFYFFFNIEYPQKFKKKLLKEEKITKLINIFTYFNIYSEHIAAKSKIRFISKCDIREKKWNNICFYEKHGSYIYVVFDCVYIYKIYI